MWYINKQDIVGPCGTGDAQAVNILACSECVTLMERFCKLHQDIKGLELHLLSKLQTEPTSPKVKKHVVKKKSFKEEESVELVSGEIGGVCGKCGSKNMYKIILHIRCLW